ncbi:MAG: ABC transporter substrate-binding protein [Holosporaceae bacterium]|jgi:ABC-type transporter MlaC component|nr:ABC transporter substrate-binding protein [Holosporaceae bacterium]
MCKIRKFCFYCAIGALFLASDAFPKAKSKCRGKHVVSESVNKDKTIDCQTFIQNLGNEAIEIINIQGISHDGVIEKFKNIVKKHFSINQIAKFCFGKHARSLNKKQKEELLRCFTNMFVKLYASSFEEYKDAHFVVTGSREKSKNKFLIESRITIEGKPDVVIVWDVSYREAEKFCICDAITNEISLRQILQAQITGNISEKGMKVFLAEFQEKYGKI